MVRPTKAVNGIIEQGRRTAHGCRNYNNYRLRMLLINAGLNGSPHLTLKSW